MNYTIETKVEWYDGARRAHRMLFFHVVKGSQFIKSFKLRAKAQEMVDALNAGTMTYKQFRKFYPATRVFQSYTSEQRSNRLASFRMGHRQREAVGEFSYMHELCPGVCYDTAQMATTIAYEKYLAQFEVSTKKVVAA